MTTPAVIPVGIPRSLIAGDSAIWDDAAISDARLGQFSPADGWTLTHYFSSPNGGNEIAAVVTDGVWRTTLTTDFTAELKDDASFEPEQVKWHAVVSYLTSRHTVRSGLLWLHPNPAGLTSYETHVEKMIRLIKVELEGRADGGGFVNSYSLPNGVAMNLVTTKELEGMLGRYLSKRDALATGQLGRGVEAHLGRAR